MEQNLRYCKSPTCAIVLTQRAGEDNWHFARRQTCNRTCGAVVARACRVVADLPPAPPCVICRTRPQSRDKRGRLYLYCANPACRRAVLHLEHLTSRDQKHTQYHWPVVTGENWPVDCFGPHDVLQSVIDRKDPRDGVSDSRFCRSPTNQNRTMGGVQAWACR